MLSIGKVIWVQVEKVADRNIHVNKDNVAASKIQKQKEFKKKLSRTYAALPFVLPGFILACVFTIYPMIFNIKISLSNYQIVHGTMDFVGLQNFIDIFNEPEGRFWYAFRNNLLYAAVTTPLIMFFGLLCAVLINNLKNGRIFFRAVFYLPVITSWVIVGMVFLYMFNQGQRGLVNYILVDILHVLPDYVPWLQNEWSGNIAIWTMGVWKNIGWAMIIYLAGLQGVPKDLYEAASIEGANAAQKFFRIVIPVIKPTSYFVLVNMIIGSFNVFLQVFLLTSGKPNGRTSVLQYLLFDKSFNQFQFGQGAAIGLMTGISVFVISVVLNRIFNMKGE